MTSRSIAIAGVSLVALTLTMAGSAAAELSPESRATEQPGHVTQLLFEFVNRRGVPANEDVGVEIRMFGGRTTSIPKLNQGAHWGEGRRITRFVPINPSVPLEDITEFVFFKHQGNPWIISSYRVRALGPNGLNRIVAEGGDLSIAPRSVGVASVGGWLWLDVVPGAGGLPSGQALNLILTYPQQSGGLNSYLFQNINEGAAWEANRTEKILIRLPRQARGFRWELAERLYLFNGTPGREAVPISVNAIRVTVRTGTADHVLFPARPRAGVARSQPVVLPVLMLVPSLN